jgi:hypothetical protein
LRVFTALDFSYTLCDALKKAREAEMDIFKSAWFTRFAKKEKISAAVLHDAVDRAERGLIDADSDPGVGDSRTF